MHHNIIIDTKSNHTVHLERDLRVRAVVICLESESGFESTDFVLEAADGPYHISLIQNPLINYLEAMAEIDRMIAERQVFQEVYGQQTEPPECSRRHILAHWEVAHWYQVDEFVDRMIVGMSVAAWNGTNRTHKIYK